jgi:hypothetical protein
MWFGISSVKCVLRFIVCLFDYLLFRLHNFMISCSTSVIVRVDVGSGTLHENSALVIPQRLTSHPVGRTVMHPAWIVPESHFISI